MASNLPASDGWTLGSDTSNVGETSHGRNVSTQPHKGKKRGRKPLNINAEKRIELSRQNARDCRARKKLRYQYVEQLVIGREKAVGTLRQELATLKQWCIALDNGQQSDECISFVQQLKQKLADTET